MPPTHAHVKMMMMMMMMMMIPMTHPILKPDGLTTEIGSLSKPFCLLPFDISGSVRVKEKKKRKEKKKSNLDHAAGLSLTYKPMTMTMRRYFQSHVCESKV